MFNNLLKIIGPILFLWLLLKIDLRELFLILKNINLLYFFLSLVFWSLLLFIRTAKWRVIINFYSEQNLPFRKLFPMLAKGIFWGIVTPVRFGEFYRAKYLKEDSNLSLTQSLWTIVLDRIMDLLVAVFLSIILLAALIYLMGMKISIVVGFLFLFVFLSTVYLLACPNHNRNILILFLKFFIPKTLREKAENVIEVFFINLKKVKFPFFLKLAGYNLLGFFSVTAAMLFLALSLRLTIPVWYLFLLDPFVSLVAILPISILGIGAREITLVFLLAPFGINASEAVTFSLLIMFSNIFIGLPGLILHLFRSSKVN